MKLLPLLLWCACHVQAYQSLTLGAGQTSTLTVPAVSPFTSMGDYRLEFRLHDWTAPSSSIALMAFPDSYLVVTLYSTGELCAIDNADTGNPQSCVALTGYADVVVRIQRWGSGAANGTAWSGSTQLGSFQLEAMDVASQAQLSSYASRTHPTFTYASSLSAISRSWAGTGTIGSASSAVGFSLAWLKWSTTLVRPRESFSNGAAFSTEAMAADLADWRFEYNMNNAGSGGYAVSLSAAGNFGSSPTGTPVCNAGPQRVLRAGYPQSLDGSYSFARNSTSSALTYFWQAAIAPSPLSWSTHAGVSPTVSGLVFGSYMFRLTVTDVSGASSSCIVKHGAVGQDANGATMAPITASELLGPLIAYGSNPWPWADDRHRTAADFNAGHLSDYYRQFWRATQGPGTIAVAANSTAVTGTGTDFTTRFCQGPENPTVPRTAAGGQAVMILIWYPNSSPEGYGLRFMDVAGCTDDTHLTLASAWNALADAAACTSCSYSYDDKSILYDGIWNYPEHAGANFYDAVAAFYALYFRTGIDDYLTAARYLADNDWKYRLDSGTVCYYGPGDRCGAGLAPRTHSLLGMILRAQDGRSDMWGGLDRMFSYYRAWAGSSFPLYGVGDVRESAYVMLGLAYCALYDPTPATASACEASLSSAMSMWTAKRYADGSWKGMYAGLSSWVSGTSANVTNGSATVTGNGTSWTANLFPTHIVFFDTPGTQPATNAAMEVTYYTATRVSTTQLTLDRPYVGSDSTNKGWVVGYGTCPNSCFVGWGAQPFMEGILGFAFYMTARALAVSDPTNAALAKQYNVGLAAWQRNYGYRSSVKGLQYAAGTVDCAYPIDDSMTWCTSAMTATQARTLNAESLRSVMTSYQDGGAAADLAFGDVLYDAMYAKPGSCGTSAICSADGDFLTDWSSWTGWYLESTGTGNPWTNRWHKYLGMSFGIGAGGSWPAARTGFVTPAARTLSIFFSLAAVPNATKAVVALTGPSGLTSITTCAASPCAISISDQPGGLALQVAYQNSSSATLASMRLPMLLQAAGAY